MVLKDYLSYRMRVCASIILITLFVSAASMTDEEIKEHLKQKDEQSDFQLSYLSYDEIVSLFFKLGADYPGYIRVFDGAEQMRESNLPSTRCFSYTEGSTERSCKYVYAILTNFTNPSHVNFTQSFYSGNFHGDEVIGPNVVAYLARYILEQPRLEILNYNYIVLLPLSNPSGYYLNQREETQFTPGSSPTTLQNHHLDRLIDMNRDFPYDQTSKSCFQTAGARIINMIWQKHLFTAAITFHGGMTAIGWPWGSTNHVTRGQRRGDLSPDHNAMQSLGKRMSDAAGTGIDTPTYPYNTLTNSIYAVGGSFEDWSYAASWESEFSPEALPKKCAGISEKEMYMNDVIARSITYLIETSNQKSPQSKFYGTWKEIDQPSKGVGHVSRNIRLTVDFIENLTPSYRVQMAPQNDFTFFAKWNLNGCSLIESTKLYVRDRSNKQYAGEAFMNKTDFQTESELLAAGFLLNKEVKNLQGEIQHSGQNAFAIIDYEQELERDIDVALVSSCDPEWRTAPSVAKPILSPQSHFVKSRLDDDYLAQNNGFSINGQKTIIKSFGPFKLQKTIIQKKIILDEDEIINQQVVSSNFFFYILIGLLIVGAVGSYLFYKCFKRIGMTQIDFQEVMDEEMSNNRDTSERSNRQIPSTRI